MRFKIRVAATIKTVLFLGACSLRAYAGSPTDPCSLLTPAQISAALGTDVDAGKLAAPRLCLWTTPNQPDLSKVKKVDIVLTTERAFGFAKTPVMKDVKATPAPDICDEGVYTLTLGVDPGAGTILSVRKGSSYFNVHVQGVRDPARVREVQKALALHVCSKL